MLARSYKINFGRQTNTGPRGYAFAALASVMRRMRIDVSDKPAQAAEAAEPAGPEPDEPEEPDKPVSFGGGPTLFPARTPAATVATPLDRPGLISRCRARHEQVPA